LLRLNRRDEAIRTRREALALYRKKAAIDQVVGEGRWIAERFDKDPRAQAAARRDVVDDLEKQFAQLQGPARAAAQAKFHADYVALVEATAPLAGKQGRASGLAALGAADLARDRAILDEAQVLGDGARWRRLGANGGDLKR